MTTTEARAETRTGAVWPILLGVAVLAGATAAAVAALSLADALTATGLPDPGPVTNYGLPFVRAAGEIAAVVAVGSFLVAAFLVPPQRTGVLDASGYRALRTGTVASGVWVAVKDDCCHWFWQRQSGSAWGVGWLSSRWASRLVTGQGS